MAVVNICCAGFRSLEFAKTDSAQVGEEVVAIGYPLGLFDSASVTRGIMSAVRYDLAYQSWVIQTDAPLNPGNSGGPLLLTDGTVAGINTLGISSTPSGDPVEGIGFAVSSRTILGELTNLRSGWVARVPTPTPPPFAWEPYFNWAHGWEITVPDTWSVATDEGWRVRWESAGNVASATVWVWEGFTASASRGTASRIEFLRGLDPLVFEITEREDEQKAGGSIGYLSYRWQDESQYCIESINEMFMLPRRGSPGYWVQISECEWSNGTHHDTLQSIF